MATKSFLTPMVRVYDFSASEILEIMWFNHSFHFDRLASPHQKLLDRLNSAEAREKQCLNTIYIYDVVEWRREGAVHD